MEKDFDAYFMAMALREAEKAADDGEVPTGCVIVEPSWHEAPNGREPTFDTDPLTARILGRAHNQTEGLQDATAHAEMLALSAAFAAKGAWRLAGTRLYVTKEPCPMCAGAIVLARVNTVVWGLDDPKRGGGTTFNIFSHPGINHHPGIVRGVMEERCRAVLQSFFRARRAAVNGGATAMGFAPASCKKVLLHTCCGPCASACAPALRDLGKEVVMFFSNSNIDTEAEYEKRLDSARKLAAAEGVELVADAYDHEDWLEKVARGFEDEPEKGARCARCFRYNLARAAAWAAAHGCEGFTTSLTVSPHKVSAMVFAAGEDAAWEVSTKCCGGSAAVAPRFIPIDFKKNNGFLRSLRRAAELGLYRQPYCGCEFSCRQSHK